MIEHLNIINALSDQIEALLDLISMSEDSVRHQSVITAAEMALNMHDELMAEIKKIENEWREKKAAGGEENGRIN